MEEATTCVCVYEDVCLYVSVMYVSSLCLLVNRQLVITVEHSESTELSLFVLLVQMYIM